MAEQSDELVVVLQLWGVLIVRSWQQTRERLKQKQKKRFEKGFHITSWAKSRDGMGCVAKMGDVIYWLRWLAARVLLSVALYCLGEANNWLLIVHHFWTHITLTLSFIFVPVRFPTFD